MSEQTDGLVIDPDAPNQSPPPPVGETPAEGVEAQSDAAPPPDDEPEAIEIPTGRVVPVGVVQSLRQELKALKPQAEKAAQLEQTVREMAPYVDFLRNNPQVLQPQPPAQPAPPTAKADPLIEATAKRYDLYTADGKPDLERAAAIVEDNRKLAREEAAKLVQPLQMQTLEQRAAVNLQAATAEVGEAAMREVVNQLAAGIQDRGALISVLADPNTMGVIKELAFAKKVRSTPAKPAAPETPPLVVESAGGQTTLTLGDDSRRLAKMAGINEKEFTDRAKRWKPDSANVLE